MQRYRVYEELKNWQNKLLDISKKNRLINFNLFKPTKTTPLKLGIILPDFNEFLDNIIENRVVLIFRNPENRRSKSSKNIEKSKDFVPLTLEEIQPDLKNARISSKQIVSNLLLEQEYLVVKSLYQKSKNYKEEKAINILYLGIGFLKWFEKTDEKTPIYSPIFLFPAQIKCQTLQGKEKIFLEFLDNAFLDINLTLLRKLQLLELDTTLSKFKVDNSLSIKENYNNFKKLFNLGNKLSNWEIIDTIQLSIFDYSKIEIYTDLVENQEKIIRNNFYKEVNYHNKTTVNGEKSGSKGSLAKTVDEFRDINPKDYFHILEADSTQEAAIQAAIRGENFILDGPPGTGKSQTITNIINEFLARGKTVLFVAEKLAALNVVYSNLKKIGLSDSVIAIHNDNIKKKEIVMNLLATLEKGQNSILINKVESNLIENTYSEFQSKLNNYGEKLTKIREQLSKSLYELIGEYQSLVNLPSFDFFLSEESVKKIDYKSLQKIEWSLNNLFLKFKHVNFNLKKHPWYGLKEVSIDEYKKQKFKSWISELVVLSSLIFENVKEFKFFLMHSDQHLDNISSLFDFLKTLYNLDTIDLEKLKAVDNLTFEIKKYIQILQIKNEVKKIELDLNKYFKVIPLSLPIFEFKEIIKNYQKSRIKFFNFKYKKIKKTLSNYFKNDVPIEIFLETLPSINLLIQKKTMFSRIIGSLKFKVNDNSDAEIENNYKQLRFYEKLKFLNDFTKIKVQEDEFVEFFLESKYTKELLLKKLFLPVESFMQIWTEFSLYLDLEQFNFKFLKKEKFEENLQQKIRKIDQIYDISRINSNICELVELGVSHFVKKAIEDNLQYDFYKIFLKKFYKLLIDQIMHSEFENFDWQTLSLNRTKFEDAQKKLDVLTQKKVDSVLLEKIPQIDFFSDKNSEIRILKQEANKSRRLMPFNELFLRIPNLLKKLKPCIMMSPLSVSSYFKNSDIEFDLVIFDEASQIKPESAIGAIARAKQYIIAGDKEQMPPTSFSDTLSVDIKLDENLTEFNVADYLSILDVSQTFLKSYRLKWHYRSKFEELIHPSNMEIYNNDLVTFPANKKPIEFQGIKFFKVEKPLYKARKNEKEAKKIVEILEKILKKHGNRYTIGIVTTNLAQEKLISSEIEKFKVKNPQFFSFFSDEAGVDFFVKNIESVQGDERDIIIFSLNFGPNEEGKISLNFGAINQENGYRRLNVAFTRAKYSTIIVSSIDPEQIDLTKTKSRGARFLKKYLEIAKYGVEKYGVESMTKSESRLISKAHFEVDVYNELIKLGYKVVKNVGFSNYKIDLAVVDSKNEEEFLLGIEFDGSVFVELKNARDREILRKKVLKMRGWSILRIWSLDWFQNPKQQIKRITDQIKMLESKKYQFHNFSNEGKSEKEKTIPKQIDKTLTLITEKFKTDFRSVFQLRFELSFQNLINLYNEIKDKYELLIYIFKKVQILYKNEFYKIVAWLGGKTKISILTKQEADTIAKELVEKGIIFTTQSHYLLKNISYYNFFLQPKRPIKEMHYFEIRDLIIKIIRNTNVIAKSDLYDLILEVTNFTSFKNKTRDYLERCLDKLMKEKIIFIDKYGNLTLDK
ncbi:DUF4011 domain-containing protein [Mesomycoplasma flocculare]|uniref:ATP-binding protein n=1 Tax=Mesomycoplasma flocculare ATCC 27399 TaxID=743971 RepID=A0A0A8E5Z7_MESFC|nr:DUF4011 domain-containing protein [Mesomycoplasma flocculare]AJC49640.1 ATP-binding protein [Mesomycoplasma flocculare ATCC 27399]ENX50852.1 hypothetical protein MFC_01154 [Mesomycoplasma flocculare ATCC 27716]